MYGKFVIVFLALFVLVVTGFAKNLRELHVFADDQTRVQCPGNGTQVGDITFPGSQDVSCDKYENR